MKAEVSMACFLVISNLETGKVESGRLKGGSESHEKYLHLIRKGLGSGKKR